MLLIKDKNDLESVKTILKRLSRLRQHVKMQKKILAKIKNSQIAAQEMKNRHTSRIEN